MHFSAFPLFRIALSLVLGILFFEYTDFSYLQLFLLVIVHGCLYFFTIRAHDVWAQKPFVSGSLLLVWCFLIGGFLLKYKDYQIFTQKISDNGQGQVLVGKLIEPIKSKHQIKFIAKIIQQNNKANEATYQNASVLLTFDALDTIASSYKVGQVVSFLCKMKEIKPNRNPRAYDYASYLRYRGITQQAFVAKSKHALCLEKDDNPLYRAAHTMSGKASQILATYLSDIKVLAIVESILIGQRMLLDDETNQSFAISGAIHVLSVSGLHVAIFISLFVWLFSLIKKEVWWWQFCKMLLLLSIIIFYVIMTGMAPSVVRSGIMVAMYLLGKTIFKGSNNFNIISFTAIIMLFYDPYYLYQISFQFSFISLISILYFQPKIAAWWLPAHAITRFFWSLVNVSLAAQIFVFPFTIYYFHQFPVYFFLSGVIAVPLSTLIIYLGTLVIIFEHICQQLNGIFVPLLHFTTSCLMHSIKWISQLPFSAIYQLWIGKSSLVLWVVSTLFAVIWLENRNIKAFYIAITLLFLTIFDHTISSIMMSQKQYLYIYDTNNGLICDYIQQNKRQTKVYGSLQDKTIQFATSNNRSFHKISEVFENHQDLHPFFCFNGSLVYFYSQSSDFIRLNGLEPIKYLVFTETSYIKPETFIQKVCPEVVIFSKNLPHQFIQKWLHLPQNQEIRIHDIKKDGAFILEAEIN